MSHNLKTVQSDAEFRKEASAAKYAAIHFWAPWCEPCKHMDVVFEELAKEYPVPQFLRVEAEELPDISEEYGVSAVPFFVILKDHKVVDQVEGADAAALTQKVTKHFGSLAASIKGPTAPLANARIASNGAASTSGAANGVGSKQQSQQALQPRLDKLVHSAPVMLFMKGTPEGPRCGFSAKVVDALQKAGIEFKHFDILSDEAVRQGLKGFTQWPTYPQLLVNGELVGGCDIITEMQQDGSLKTAVQEALGAKLDANTALQQRIKHLLDSSPVVLFMKGNPDAPRCGFSQQVVSALRSIDVPFDSHDILKDEELRQGLKDYSQWPTYPQLYVKGELLGGCDVILEMQQDGELKHAINETLGAGSAAPVEQRIHKLLKDNPVMLFMKGSREEPRCGFSQRVVAALQAIQEPFKTFDILSDEDVRQGLKKMFDWPTFPQLYVNGELLGGCDIITEMANSGDLQETVEEMKNRMT
ncbi:hypothetical protein ABBQ32_010174 [Trebouxia sp. C0010 RCD-2024]